MEAFDFREIMSGVRGTPNLDAISLIFSWLAVTSADNVDWATLIGAAAITGFGAGFCGTATGIEIGAETGADTVTEEVCGRLATG